MKHISRIEDHSVLIHRRWLRVISGVAVEQPPGLFIPLHAHAVRHQRIQRHDLAASIAQDLGERITIEQQMCHQGFPERIAAHFRVWLVMEQEEQRVILRFLLISVFAALINMQRQAGDGFAEHTHTGVHSGHLHGGALRHRLSGGALPEKEAWTGTGGAVFHPRFEQIEKAHFFPPPALHGGFSLSGVFA